MNCPFCYYLYGEDVEMKELRPTGAGGQQVTQFSDGAFRCDECGLFGPKQVIETIEYFVHLGLESEGET